MNLSSDVDLMFCFAEPGRTHKPQGGSGFLAAILQF